MLWIIGIVELLVLTLNKFRRIRSRAIFFCGVVNPIGSIDFRDLVAVLMLSGVITISIFSPGNIFGVNYSDFQ